MAGPKGYIHGWIRVGGGQTTEVHLHRGAKYRGKVTVGKISGPDENGYYGLHSAASGQVIDYAKSEEMHPDEASAKASAKANRKKPEKRQQQSLYGDYRTVALLNGIDPRTGRPIRKTNLSNVNLAVDSMLKANTPEPIGKPGGPGLWHHKGLQLPPLIQHVAHALIEAGHPTSRAIGMAVGIIKNWAHAHPSGGEKSIHPDTVAAAQLALKEWELLKATHGGTKKHLSNGAAPSIDLAGFKPSQQRAAAGSSTGGQWAAQGGQAPTQKVQSKPFKDWHAKQVGHYPPGMTSPAQRQQWDNWFRFFGLPAKQQRALMRAGKAPKKPKGASSGPKGKKAKPAPLPVDTTGWAPMPVLSGGPVSAIDLADANTTVGGVTDSRSMVVNTLLTKHIRSAHGMKTPKGTPPGRMVKLHKALHAPGGAGHSHKGASMSNATQQSFDLATLTTKERKATRRFGLPSERKYPLPDKSHAANAKARAAQMLKAGKITQSQHDRIVRVANKLLGNSSSKNMSNPLAVPGNALGRVLGINLARSSGRKMSPYRPKGAERQRVVEHLRAARALHRSGRTKQAASIHSALLASATNRARVMPDGSRRAHTKTEAKLGITILNRQSMVKGTGIADGKLGKTVPADAVRAKNTDRPVPKNQRGETAYKRHKSPEPTVATSGGAAAAIQAKSTAPAPHGPRPSSTIYPSRGGTGK